MVAHPSSGARRICRSVPQLHRRLVGGPMRARVQVIVGMVVVAALFASCGSSSKKSSGSNTSNGNSPTTVKPASNGGGGSGSGTCGEAENFAKALASSTAHATDLKSTIQGEKDALDNARSKIP